MILKKDDYVYRDDRKSVEGIFIAKVVRVTNTLAILESGQRLYNMSSESGHFRFLGGSWRDAVYFATDEKKNEFLNIKPTD